MVRRRVQAFEQAKPSNDQGLASPSDIDWTKGFAAGWNPRSPQGRLLNFWADWAQAQGQRLTPEDRANFEAGFSRFPAYFAEELARRSAIDPLLTKALMQRLELLPVDSPLNRDIELRGALTVKAGEILRGSELDSIQRDTLLRYESHAPSYFPQSYRPLSESELSEWKSKIEALPPVLARFLHRGDLGIGPFFMLAHELGLSKLGVPLKP